MVERYVIVMNRKTGCTGNEETRKRKIVIVGTSVVVLCCVVRVWR